MSRRHICECSSFSGGALSIKGTFEPLKKHFNNYTNWNFTGMIRVKSVPTTAWLTWWRLCTGNSVCLEKHFYTFCRKHSSFPLHRQHFHSCWNRTVPLRPVKLNHTPVPVCNRMLATMDDERWILHVRPQIQIIFFGFFGQIFKKVIIRMNFQKLDNSDLVPSRSSMVFSSLATVLSANSARVSAWE